MKLNNIIGCHKIFGNDKKMNFTYENEELLERYKKIFKDISNKIGKKFSSKPTFVDYYGEYIKAKMHETKTSFFNNNVPEETLITCVQQS